MALARALAVRPRALLLDEPLTALDAKLREQLRVEIDRLLRRLGITAVYVTHDQAEAMALGDRIVVMEKGRIAQIGTPHEIYYRSGHRLRRRFHRHHEPHLGRDRRRLPGASQRAPSPGHRSPRARSCSAPRTCASSHPASITSPATVISSFFLGDHTRLVVDAGGSTPIVVETTERRTWPRGETVHLALAPGAILPVPGQAP